MNSQQRADIWNSLLDAEMYERYWTSEAQRYSFQDRIMAIAVAVLTSGTAAALYSTYPVAAKVIAFFASGMSIIHATVFNRMRVKQVSSLALRWKELAIELKLLWAQVTCKSSDKLRLWNQYVELSHREKQIDDSAFTVNRKRMAVAQDQVNQARGLKYEPKRPQVTPTAATPTAAPAAATAAATANSNS